MRPIDTDKFLNWLKKQEANQNELKMKSAGNDDYCSAMLHEAQADVYESIQTFIEWPQDWGFDCFVEDDGK